MISCRCAGECWASGVIVLNVVFYVNIWHEILRKMAILYNKLMAVVFGCVMNADTGVIGLELTSEGDTLITHHCQKPHPSTYHRRH